MARIQSKINSLQIGLRSLSIRLFLASLQIDFILMAYWLTTTIGKTINIILDNQNEYAYEQNLI